MFNVGVRKPILLSIAFILIIIGIYLLFNEFMLFFHEDEFKQTISIPPLSYYKMGVVGIRCDVHISIKSNRGVNVAIIDSKNNVYRRNDGVMEISYYIHPHTQLYIVFANYNLLPASVSVTQIVRIKSNLNMQIIFLAIILFITAIVFVKLAFS